MLLKSMNSILWGHFWTKKFIFFGETYLHNIIFGILVQNGFGTQIVAKLGNYPKKLRKKLDRW
jgi:hypothetical protein